MSPREQRLVRVAAWVVGLGLLWWVGLAPALDTLRQSKARHARLDKELALVQAQAASAEVLRTQNATPPPGREAALRALEEATRGLGAGASLAQQGDRATVTLKGVAPGALAQWLQQVRINARVLPVQAQIQRGDQAAWSGQIVLAGPGLGAGN
ncbi:type II secretion system protein GspM [Hydrogenophaga sp. MI9]|uniref:type II secretion system protein GspM n=1 Tax=Hydrogenophaga sp. MI9 TaxID=3453719 RepID=UPI003EED77AF